MKSKLELTVILTLVILPAPLTVRAQQTSRVIPFNNVTTTIAPGTVGQALTIQLWDAAAAGTLMYCENQTLDVDASQAIAFDFGAGTAVAPACPSSPPGLNPADFLSGSSRFLDVVDGVGASVLAARIPLNATAFALSPGPQGPPGVVQTVTAGDTSVVTGGTPANPTVAVANGGITAAKLAAGAVGSAQIANGAVTSAHLASNAITHNTTLSGDGTSGAPLSVAAPLNLSGSTNLELLRVVNNGIGGDSIGVFGQVQNGHGVFGASTNGNGVRALSTNGTGVRGTTTSGDGVVGLSISGRGAIGGSQSGIGVVGGSQSGVGVQGTTNAAHTFTQSAVYGLSSGDGGIGVIGEANIGNAWGVYGKSANGVGVVGEATGTGLAGMFIGKVQVKILQITGGADLSERFEVRGANQVAGHAASKAIEPGMVVVIDPQNAGKLSVSSMAYDRRVVGVISGAGGVKPGMLMGQSGSIADGDQPVALAGRVYCWADASHDPIEPGDLLTTSETPGHAMKVIDHQRAPGAIIGKALTGLKGSTGLVLVLVTLQ